ncbi:arginase family protein [Leucobacter sp. UCMA 4100]|uniref:arginase family protein n=1 Tax=Leucobacter sp. UCMA 4100 TaxID=2810534 RepID=UPI0022EA6C06|nr:arginase family protein [Leucobacter sp. UCMA 4100]MDA3147724.1 arginase family protein [Leucobacter sp. UCMA 4100]
MSQPRLSHDPLWPRAGAFAPLDTENGADMTIVGVPTWRTSLSATNAGVTPEAVREALKRYSTHFVASDGSERQTVLTDELTIADAGDVDEPDLDEALAARYLSQIAEFSGLVLAIGGDNALTVPVALGVAGEKVNTAGIITLDAHHDLREGRSNGSPIRRLIEEHGFDPSRIVQIGIADFANSAPYRDYAERKGITVIHRDELHERSMADVMADALKIAGSAGGPIHVDLDVDVCDRSVVPACPASIPGGLSAYELRQAARIAARHRQVRSIDIAEVDAEADAADGRTVRLAALLVLEAAAGMTER